MANKQFALQVWEVLEKSFPNSHCSLVNDTPYRLAVRGILSAQCTDIRVNKETETLFTKYPLPEDIYALDENILEAEIRPCGLSKSKARSIKEFTFFFLEKWNQTIPHDTEELEKVTGVGRKIANLIVGEVYGIQRIVVDTHLKRVAYRIGLTEETLPIKVETDLNKIFKENQRIMLGHRMIDLGRSYCNSRNPNCGACPMNKICHKHFD